MQHICEVTKVGKGVIEVNVDGKLMKTDADKQTHKFNKGDTCLAEVAFDKYIVSLTPRTV